MLFQKSTNDPFHRRQLLPVFPPGPHDARVFSVKSLNKRPCVGRQRLVLRWARLAVAFLKLRRARQRPVVRIAAARADVFRVKLLARIYRQHRGPVRVSFVWVGLAVVAPVACLELCLAPRWSACDSICEEKAHGVDYSSPASLVAAHLWT